MGNLVKTTVTIPEDIIKAARVTAVNEGTTLSNIIREALKTRVYGREKSARRDPMKLAGKYSIGIGRIYNKRSDLYDEHLKRKMGI